MSGMLPEAFNRDVMAGWYARRHGDIDPGVIRILYLPTNAPDREIRFLEVNRLIPDTTFLEPIDFGVDTDSDNAHSLHVLDVTPAQWDAIETGKLGLPGGWILDGYKILWPLDRPHA